MHPRNSILRLLACCWIALAATTVAAQPAGSALLQTGNTLFRSGQYAEARDRYEEALATGLDTPLLHYNLGVAYYRLGNFQKAELALMRAAEDPTLAALATYNLGLATLAAGWPEVAASRFESVASLTSDRRLIGLADRALASLMESREERAVRPNRPSDTWRPWREAEPAIGQMSFIVAARYGTDDNVYRTPSAPYVDITQPGLPLVVPVRQSASFMPVDLLTRYAIEAPELETRFNLAYRLNGDFYDSAFSNANVVTQRFQVGADVALDGKHARALEANFYGTIHDETNFDPDTGLDRDLAGEDISDRFSYRGAGIETYYDHDIGRWVFGFDTRIERRSYDDPSPFSRYDHEFYDLGLWAEWNLSEAMTLEFGVDGYRREYDVRRARDLTGLLSTANPALEYAYGMVHVGVTRHLGTSLSLRGRLRQVERSDNFEGYGDYSQSVLSVGLTWRPSRRLRIGADALVRSFDYPNAFAFNQPSGGRLSIDSTDAEVELEYLFTPTLSVWTELELIDDASSDPRIEYARNRAILGIKWRYR